MRQKNCIPLNDYDEDTAVCIPRWDGMIFIHACCSLVDLCIIEKQLRFNGFSGTGKSFRSRREF